MYENTGPRICLAMAARGVFKLSVIAVAVGVSESAVSRWRKGEPLTLLNAVRLCDVLDVSLDWLLLGRGSMDSHHSSVFCTTSHRDLLGKLPPNTRKLLEAFLASLTLSV